jgi:hypothetical protein
MMDFRSGVRIKISYDGADGMMMVTIPSGSAGQECKHLKSFKIREF